MGVFVNIFLLGGLQLMVTSGQNFKPNIWSIDSASTNNVSGITFFHDNPSENNDPFSLWNRRNNKPADEPKNIMPNYLSRTAGLQTQTTAEPDTVKAETDFVIQEESNSNSMIHPPYFSNINGQAPSNKKPSLPYPYLRANTMHDPGSDTNIDDTNTPNSRDSGSAIPIVSMKTGLASAGSWNDPVLTNNQPVDLSQLGILGEQTRASSDSTITNGAANSVIARTSAAGAWIQTMPVKTSGIGLNEVKLEKHIGTNKHQTSGKLMGLWNKTKFEDHSKKALLTPKHKFIDMRESGIKPKGVFTHMSKIPTKTQKSPSISGISTLGVFKSGDASNTASIDINKRKNTSISNVPGKNTVADNLNSHSIEGSVISNGLPKDTAKTLNVNQDASNLGSFVDFSSTDMSQRDHDSAINNKINNFQNKDSEFKPGYAQPGDHLKIDNLYPDFKSTGEMTNSRNSIQQSVTSVTNGRIVNAIQTGVRNVGNDVNDGTISGDENAVVRVFVSNDQSVASGSDMAIMENGVLFPTRSMSGQNTHGNQFLIGRDGTTILPSSKNNPIVQPNTIDEGGTPIDNDGIMSSADTRPKYIPTNNGVMMPQDNAGTIAMPSSNDDSVMTGNKLANSVSANAGSNIPPTTNTAGFFPAAGTELMSGKNRGLHVVSGNIGVLRPASTSSNVNPPPDGGVVIVNGGLESSRDPNSGVVDTFGRVPSNGGNGEAFERNNGILPAENNGMFPSLNSGSNIMASNVNNMMSSAPNIPSGMFDHVNGPANINNNHNSVAQSFGLNTNTGSLHVANSDWNNFQTLSNRPTVLNQPQVSGFVQVSGPNGPILVPQSGFNGNRNIRRMSNTENFATPSMTTRQFPNSQNTATGQDRRDSVNIPNTQNVPSGIRVTHTGNIPLNPTGQFASVNVPNNQPFANGQNSVNTVNQNNQQFQNRPSNFQNSKQFKTRQNNLNDQITQMNFQTNPQSRNWQASPSRQNFPQNFLNNRQFRNGQNRANSFITQNNQQFQNQQNSINGQRMPPNINFQTGNFGDTQSNMQRRNPFLNVPTTFQSGQNNMPFMNTISNSIPMQGQRFVNRQQIQNPFVGPPLRNGLQPLPIGRLGMAAPFPVQPQFRNGPMSVPGGVNQFASPNNFPQSNMPLIPFR